MDIEAPGLLWRVVGQPKPLDVLEGFFDRFYDGERTNVPRATDALATSSGTR